MEIASVTVSRSKETKKNNKLHVELSHPFKARDAGDSMNLKLTGTVSASEDCAFEQGKNGKFKLNTCGKI